MGGRTTRGASKMYTLLGASVLGFDLVRREGGGVVASLLNEALALTPGDLPVLAAARPVGLLTNDDQRVVAAVGDLSPMSTALGEMTRLVGAGRVKEALQLIEAAPMSGLPDLLRCVREEVLDWVWSDEGPEDVEVALALAVVSDAVTAAYHASALDEPVVQKLYEPWARAGLARRSIDLGPCQAEVDDLLARLTHLDASSRRFMLEAAAYARLRGGWARAMHSATWAVHMADRVRPAAAAQLRAVRVLVDAELSVSDSAAGVWNLVSGGVQATVVGDLLDEATSERLLAPLEAALRAAE